MSASLQRAEHTIVARTYSSFGDRAFAAAGPVLWNSLPVAPKSGGLTVRSIPAAAAATFLFG